MPSFQEIRADEIELAFAAETVLSDLSFTIPAGRFVSIVGPSGCGKTSLLRLVAGLQNPTRGEIQFVGAESTWPQVGYVFQEPRLLPWRTVKENVCLPLELLGQNGSASRETVEQALSMVGLGEQDGKKFPRQLSGGMQMRVSLARALIRHPEILLLDEPFAALDDLLRYRLNQELLQLWQVQQWTAIFVTHNVSEAVFLSQEVLVMKDRPSSIISRVEIPFTYPRTPELRSTAEFARLTGELSSKL
jgi:NitT/TauT family transport system ATP-binding protein